MPQLNSWSEFFNNTVNSIAKSFGNIFPDGVDREKLENIEEKINELWLSEDGTWAEFQGAVGEYRIFWFEVKQKDEREDKKCLKDMP